MFVIMTITTGTKETCFKQDPKLGNYDCLVSPS